jgi:hypothetical protein
VFLAAPVSIEPATIGRVAPTMGMPLEVVGYGQRTAGDDGTLGLEYAAAMSVTEIGTTEIRALGAASPPACAAPGDSGGPVLDGARVAGVSSHAGGETFDCVYGSIYERVDVYVDWIVANAPNVCMHSDVCEEPEPDPEPEPEPETDSGCHASGESSIAFALMLCVLLSRRARAGRRGCARARA